MRNDDVPSADQPASTPAPLVVAASLAAVEAIFVLLFAVVELVTTNRERLVMGGTTALFFAIYGVTLAVCAHGLVKGRSWARGPVLLAQLIWLGLAWNFRDSELTVLAVCAALAAVIAIAGLVHPASTDALARDRPADPAP